MCVGSLKAWGERNGGRIGKQADEEKKKVNKKSISQNNKIRCSALVPSFASLLLDWQFHFSYTRTIDNSAVTV